MKSWRTTLAGILMLVGAAGQGIQDPKKLTNLETISIIAGAVGLITARDQKEHENDKKSLTTIK